MSIAPSSTHSTHRFAMSKLFFEPAEFADRQSRVRAAMQRKSLDALIVISPININYLVGAAAKAYQVFQCLIFTLEEKPLTLMLRLGDVAEMLDLSLAEDVRGWGGRRYEDPIEVFRRIMAEKGLLKARIGIEMPAYYLSVHNYLKLKDVLADATVSDETMLVERLKYVKSPAEIEYIREAARIADVGIQSIRSILKAGLTEREVAAEAHRAMMAAGGDSPASPMNFVSGERTCYAHGLPTDRVLQRGDFMHIEFGGQYRRYCSTIARHFSIDEPSERARSVHQATFDACQAAISTMRHGALAEDVHRAAVGVLRDAELEPYNLHTTGYGIAPGFPPSWGESVNLFDQSQDVLAAGMVLSVEPPVFIHAERLGARLIDCVLIHDDHAEVLSKCPADLIVV
ncbi:M24 family metallopeptidase [Paraburkholderia sp. SG-MS1]|uniref:M24 family metallopeptidase n=1 Tax=Paraburkholderia sp. SG-MS1 TaxID=2023741 RepID=UPI0014465D92|nr:Xaa-Pro peptidase family protein [Paraburkholderia sp. SG-MS1]